MTEISVIVPVYTVEAYLGKSLESISKQTFRDFELIIVNDGSKDNCFSIMKDFKKNHPELKIFIINQENKGQAGARNSGIAVSCGKYLCFVDGDDFVEPAMLSDLLDIANETDADIVVGYHSRNKQYLFVSKGNQNIKLESGKEWLSNVLTATGSDYTNTTSVCGKLYKRYIWEKIKFPEGRVYEDEAVFHSVMLLTNKIASVHVPYYHYIKRANSTVNDKKNAKYLFDKAVAFEYRTKEMMQIDSSLGTEYAKRFYAFCIDTFLLLDQYGLELDKQEFLKYFQKKRSIFINSIPWHQKVCVFLIQTGGEKALNYLIAHQFAPGRKTILSIKMIISKSRNKEA